MPPPVVSCVIASHNHARFIEELLQTIMAQTFHDLEIVVVDDGSSDKTLEIARRVAQRDARISVYSQANQGVVSARNAGIERSSGRYISVVDSDDLWPEDRTAKMVSVLERDLNVSLVYGDAEILREGERRVARFFEIYPVVPGPFSEALFCNYCFVPAVSVMFRRSRFERTGVFWGPGPSSDYLKWIELGLEGSAVCLSSTVLGKWRLHGGNVSQKSAPERVQQYSDLCHALIELTKRHPGWARGVGTARQHHRYSRCYVMAGFYAGRAGDWALARDQFRIALSYERSFLNAALWFSTLPILNYMSSIVYGWTARKFLRALA